MGLFVFLFSFSLGRLYRPNAPRMAQEGSFQRKLKVLMPVLSDQKLEGNWASSHALFFPNSPDQNFEIVILFSIIEKSNNYVFGDD